MKISPSPSPAHWGNCEEAPGREQRVSEAPGRCDVAEFARGRSTLGDKGLLSLKARLLGEVNQPAATQRLEELKAQIHAGEYHIPTGELVRAILGGPEQ